LRHNVEIKSKCQPGEGARLKKLGFVWNVYYSSTNGIAVNHVEPRADVLD
jgi:hypothetical protein